jgi:class 3 adenylate cyclase
MCASAADGQILIDPTLAAEVAEIIALQPLGTRPLRGFADAVPVFAVRERTAELAAPRSS